MALEILRDRVSAGGQVEAYQRSFDLVREVGSGARGATLRLYRPAPVVAFGRRDEFKPGFEAAAQACREHGFEPLVRKVGGHAAGYHESCLVVDHFQPAQDAVSGNNDRFAFFGEIFVETLEALGVQAGVGELPGEYCPGEFSVFGVTKSGARVKLVGTAQRVVSGAWWFSSGIVVDDTEPLRAVTRDVYEALGLPLDPATVGSVVDCRPGVLVSDVEEALLEVYAQNGLL